MDPPDPIFFSGFSACVAVNLDFLSFSSEVDHADTSKPQVDSFILVFFYHSIFLIIYLFYISVYSVYSIESTTFYNKGYTLRDL